MTNSRAPEGNGVDAAYLDLLNDMLKNDSSADFTMDPDHAKPNGNLQIYEITKFNLLLASILSPIAISGVNSASSDANVDYLDMLYDLIVNKEDTNTSINITADPIATSTPSTKFL